MVTGCLSCFCGLIETGMQTFSSTTVKTSSMLDIEKPTVCLSCFDTTALSKCLLLCIVVGQQVVMNETLSAQRQ